jgi:hypothetical protein
MFVRMMSLRVADNGGDWRSCLTKCLIELQNLKFRTNDK